MKRAPLDPLHATPDRSIRRNGGSCGACRARGLRIADDQKTEGGDQGEAQPAIAHAHSPLEQRLGEGKV
jgi:hypothetical protein